MLLHKPPPKPIPWPVLVAAVALIVAALGAATLYIPHLQGNRVRVDGLQAQLRAWPDKQAPSEVNLDLQLTGPTDDVTGVDFVTDMPTMGRMSGQVVRQWRTAEGHYRAVAELEMGGLWRVQTTIHRGSARDEVASFDINI